MSIPAVRTAEREESDFALARRVASGDTPAFEAIMRRHNRMLYRIARSILRDETEAEDCLQSAYLLAFRSIGSFAGQARLSTWLGRIVINEALGRKRRAAREGSTVAFEGTSGSGSAVHESPALSAENAGPEAEAMRRELRSIVERRVDALPEAFRAVFVLRAFEELSVEEIAATLRVPAATVRTRFFRARGLLRESLAQDLESAKYGQAFAFAGARCDRIVAAVLGRLGFPAPAIDRAMPCALA